MVRRVSCEINPFTYSGDSSSKYIEKRKPFESMELVSLSKSDTQMGVLVCLSSLIMKNTFSFLEISMVYLSEEFELKIVSVPIGEQFCVSMVKSQFQVPMKTSLSSKSWSFWQPTREKKIARIRMILILPDKIVLIEFTLLPGEVRWPKVINEKTILAYCTRNSICPGFVKVDCEAIFLLS